MRNGGGVGAGQTDIQTDFALLVYRCPSSSSCICNAFYVRQTFRMGLMDDDYLFQQNLNYAGKVRNLYDTFVCIHE